jgi:hypothetical protein
LHAEPQEASAAFVEANPEQNVPAGQSWTSPFVHVIRLPVAEHWQVVLFVEEASANSALFCAGTASLRHESSSSLRSHTMQTPPVKQPSQRQIRPTIIPLRLLHECTPGSISHGKVAFRSERHRSLIDQCGSALRGSIKQCHFSVSPPGRSMGATPQSSVENTTKITAIRPTEKKAARALVHCSGLVGEVKLRPVLCTFDEGFSSSQPSRL